MTLAIDPDTNDCPLCMEELDVLEKHFKPCTCGYQICRFCWHHIKSNLNGRCPGCRRLYSEQHIRFVPISEELIKEIEKDEGVKVRMAGEPSKQQLSALRVIQRNVVHVINMSLKHADMNNEMLRKFGKIEKLVITKPPSIGAGFYLTFAKEADANRAREELNGMKLEGETIRTFFGTTKYCTHFINKTKCPIKECLFLHELVADKPKTAPTGKQKAIPSYAIKISEALKATSFLRSDIPSSQTWPSLPSTSFQEFREFSASIRAENSSPKTTKPSGNKKTQKKRMKPLIIEKTEDPHLPSTVSWARPQSATIVNVAVPSDTAVSSSRGNHSVSESKYKSKKKTSKTKTARLEELKESKQEEKKALAVLKTEPFSLKKNVPKTNVRQSQKVRAGLDNETNQKKETAQAEIKQPCLPEAEEQCPPEEKEEQLPEKEEEERLSEEKEQRLPEEKEGLEIKESDGSDSLNTLDSLKSIIKVCDPQMPAQKLWADKVTNETDSIFVKETHPENFSLDRASQPTSIEPAKTTFRLSSHLLHLRQKAEHQTEDQSIAFGSNTSKWSVDRNFDPFGENNHFLKSAQESNGFQSNTPRKEFYRDFFQPSLTIPANPPNQGLSGARSLGSFPVPNDWGFLEPSIGSYPDLSFMYSEEPKYSTDSPYGNTSYFGGPYPPQIEESVRQRPGFYSNYGPEEYSLQTGAYLGRNWLQPVENRYSHPLGQYQFDYRMTNNQAISKEFYPHYRYERMADTDVCFQRKVPVYHHERGYTFVNGAWFPSQQVMFQSPFVPQRPNAYRPPRVYQEDEYRNMKSMHLG